MEWFDHVDVTPPFSHGEWLGKFNLLKYNNFSIHQRGMGVETEGESNNLLEHT